MSMTDRVERHRKGRPALWPSGKLRLAENLEATKAGAQSCGIEVTYLTWFG